MWAAGVFPLAPYDLKLHYSYLLEPYHLLHPIVVDSLSSETHDITRTYTQTVMGTQLMAIIPPHSCRGASQITAVPPPLALSTSPFSTMRHNIRKTYQLLPRMVGTSNGCSDKCDCAGGGNDALTALRGGWRVGAWSQGAAGVGHGGSKGLESRLLLLVWEDTKESSYSKSGEREKWGTHGKGHVRKLVKTQESRLILTSSSWNAIDDGSGANQDTHLRPSHFSAFPPRMAAVNSSGPIAYVVGPHLAGSSVGALFTGVIAHQFVRYLSEYPDEPVYRRAYVYIAVLISMASAALQFAMSWEKIINGVQLLGNPDLPMTGSSCMIAAFLALYVQAFYLHRLFLLSCRNWWLVAFLGTILFLAFLLSLVAVGVRLRPSASNETTLLLYNVYFSVLLGGDILLTLITVGYLVYFRKQVLPQSAGLYKSVILVVFQSAAPATLWMSVQYAFCVAFPNTPSAPFARVTATLGMNLVLNKLWAISLLATLNSRPKRTKSVDEVLSELRH
ncbi:hypothetical protein MIND_01410000 [Mycena indigotica]|uniref:Uncharacterized protein n=1 Tax=Mycena indigotica TaxID=2126181 RepID=A0A8H6RXV6_9AGAR|nr:uncharacterized protein MIND_01410000 [Mycena indigotica]KAF7288936.1 hypothetical protein MIND_01410000 [Mycena indigotica]